ncbi:MAG: prepilin-type N-terminal cleavage/methylation domain-containing protein [Gammaproteobacteria bacterium]|nr:prepilin-type N-terminal cleavage/methylation domain-containing protein [Gammaproteobacteria bacterium]MCI0590564.1 prepilin-type N-terminal cleavage/methylation domain-containing protein [Gammaproteobacteria bacterium]
MTSTEIDGTEVLVDPKDTSRIGRLEEGYTLVELVLVVTLMGILAAFTIPRFFSKDVFEERGFFEESLAAVRYAQKLAIVSGCDIHVRFNSTGYSVGQWAVCVPANHTNPVTAVARPGGGPFTNSAPDSVTVGNRAFYFDKIGRPRRDDANGTLIVNPTDLVITIGSRLIQVEPETGFTRLP